MKKTTTVILILIMSATLVIPAFASGNGGIGSDTVTQTVIANSTETDGINTPSVNADGQTEIYDYEDLFSIRDNIAGSYILMADIDLKDKKWTPVDFTGTFDGNGYAILNAEITTLSEAVRTTKDGNMVCYDTFFAGFFGVAELATIKNLKLLGINVNVESNVPTFIGGIAGFMEETTISNCTVEGKLTLKTSGANWGIGGFMGFGNGSISDSIANVTLVGVDTDAANKDEQFMGGAYAVGYADLINNSVDIQGYVTEHGYAHNGGLVGMYELYYPSIEYYGEISYNWVSGHITFYEDNDDPRAYCEPYIGEVMTWCFNYEGNGENFFPNNITEEHRESGFTTTLLPHSCANPTYNDSVTNSTCTDYGFTEHTCSSCGYTYRSDYSPLGHTVNNWTAVKEASATENGLEKGTCDNCGVTVFHSVALDIVVPTEETTTTAQGQADGVQTTSDASKKESKGISTLGIIIIILVVIAIVVVVVLIINNRKKRRRRRRKSSGIRVSDRHHLDDGYRSHDRSDNRSYDHSDLRSYDRANNKSYEHSNKHGNDRYFEDRHRSGRR